MKALLIIALIFASVYTQAVVVAPQYHCTKCTDGVIRVSAGKALRRLQAPVVHPSWCPKHYTHKAPCGATVPARRLQAVAMCEVDGFICINNVSKQACGAL